MKLVDEFSLEWNRTEAAKACVIDVHGVFGDLLWPPGGDSAEDVFARAEADPAFTITAFSRWVALARIFDEIRFYAAPIPEGATPWWWTGERPARVDAIKAEPDEYELGSFATVSNAVAFTSAYLTGSRLHAIATERAATLHGPHRWKKE